MKKTILLFVLEAGAKFATTLTEKIISRVSTLIFGT